MSSNGNHDSNTRDRLIAAALEIIDEKGASELKVGEVVSRAGTTTGSLYWFFRDRQHLIDAALADRYVNHMRTVLNRINKIMKEHDLPIDALLARPTDITEETRVRARRRQIRVVADALEDPGLAAEIASIQRQFIGIAVEVVERAQERGQIRDDVDAFALAVFSQSITIGLALADLDPDLMPDPHEWWHLTEIFLEALRPR